MNTNETLLKKLPRHPRTGKIFTIATRKGGGMGWHEICLGSINGKARVGHTEQEIASMNEARFKDVLFIK